jgi:hypothetical protein
MTDEELEKLIQEITGQMEQLPGPEKSLNRKERKQKWLLELKLEALNKIKEAKKKGSLQQEMKASVDYTLLVNYGEKHPLLINYIKSQAGWYGF